MLKIPQARCQQYMHRELPDVQAGFRKGRGTRDQIANICWIIEKASKPVSSVTQSCPTLCDPMNRSTPGTLSITNSRSLPKLMTIESVMPSIHLILCHPLLLLPSIFPSIRNPWTVWKGFHRSAYNYRIHWLWASLVVQVIKNPVANAGDARDMGSVPGLGSSPRIGNGNSLQYLA